MTSMGVDASHASIQQCINEGIKLGYLIDIAPGKMHEINRG